MPVEFQIISIFAVNKGFVDKLDVAQVRPFEAALHAHLKSRHAALLAGLKEKPEIKGEVEEKLGAAIKEFAAEFMKTVQQ